MTKVSLFEVLQAQRAIILQSLSELSDLTPEDALDRRSLELRLEQLDEELAQAPLPPLETGDDHAQLGSPRGGGPGVESSSRPRPRCSVSRSGCWRFSTVASLAAA